MDGRVLTVIGVGGCGRRVVNEMIRLGSLRERFSEDLAALFTIENEMHGGIPSLADREILVPAMPENGRVPENCAERLEPIPEAVQHTPVVLIAVGLGGKTGTTLAPIIGEMAMKAGALVIGLAVLPCFCEGNKRNKRAMAGLKVLQAAVDTLILVPGNHAEPQGSRKKTFRETLATVCGACAEAGIALYESLFPTGRAATDTADHALVFRSGRLALLGTGAGVHADECDSSYGGSTTPLLMVFPAHWNEQDLFHDSPEKTQPVLCIQMQGDSLKLGFDRLPQKTGEVFHGKVCAYAEKLFALLPSDISGTAITVNSLNARLERGNRFITLCRRQIDKSVPVAGLAEQLWLFFTDIDKALDDSQAF